MLWLTRPYADSAAFAATLSVPHLIAPVLHIELLEAPHLPQADAILLTSRHAIAAIQHLPKDMPIYCVGKATADAARMVGFQNLHIGDGDIQSLLPIIACNTLLYPSAAEITADVAPALAARGIALHRVITYHAVATPTLSDELQRALEQNKITSVAFFSARSAQITVDKMRALNLAHYAPHITAFCLSQAVADAARATPWHAIHVAPHPTSNAMRALIASSEKL